MARKPNTKKKKEGMDRRNFIKTSFVAAGGIALASNMVLGQEWNMKASVTGPSLLRRVRLVIPESGATNNRESDIKIEKGRISEIAPTGEIPSKGMEIIEGDGRFALPGLIDCHVHSCGFFMTEMPGVSDFPWIFRQIGLNYRASLLSGVTTFRDMTAPLRMILHMRNRSKDPRSGYPKLVCCGPMITVVNGYPPHVPPDKAWMRSAIGPLRVELKTNKDAFHWVDRLAEAGVDWIKIGYSSIRYDEARTPLATPSPELFRAIVDHAHHHQLPVAVHHTWLTDLRKLVDLPFDTLEHLTGDADIDPPTLDKIAERKLAVTTNLEVFAMLDEPERQMAKIKQGNAPLMPKAQKSMIKLLNDLAAGKDIVVGRPPVPLFGLKALKGTAAHEERNLKLLYDHGVLIGASTDAGLPLLFGSLPDEMCHMAKAGMSTAAVLRAATSDAARVLRIENIGSIKKGFQADIVLYNGDPIADLEVIKKPALVIRDGVPTTTNG